MKNETGFNEGILNMNKSDNSKSNLNSQKINEGNNIIKDITFNKINSIDKVNNENILDENNLNNWHNLLLNNYTLNTDNFSNLTDESFENKENDKEINNINFIKDT